MRSKIAIPNMKTLPVAMNLPQGKAASIGRTLTRYAYLEWRLAKTIYALLGTGIKQGRVAVRFPQARACTTIAENLLEAHRVRTNYNFRQFGKKLDAAERARNLLAHSIYQKAPDGKILIQMVRGSIDLGQDVMPITRAVDPESRLLDRGFLAEQRKHVEQGIKAVEEFERFALGILAALNEKRRTLVALDRRRPLQSGNTPPAQPQSSRG